MTKNEKSPDIILALRPADAAASLGIGVRTLWTLTNRGEIPHVRIGSRVVYPTLELEQWLTSQAKGGAANDN